MTTQPPAVLPYTESQRREATEWFVLIQDEDDPKAETILSWSRWLEAAEGNRLAFEAVVHTWHSIPASPSLPMPTAREVALDPYDGDQSIAEWLESKRSDRTSRDFRFRPKTLAGWALSLAASMAVFALLGVIMSRFLGSTTKSMDEFVTKTGEQLELTLIDGSHVWLGPKSRLSVAFTPERRVVHLEMGEAFFAVKKDHSRPFIVRAPQGDITAVGTAFDVRALADKVTVEVTEGVVSVAPEPRSAGVTPGVVRVASGQQVVIDPRLAAPALAVTQSENPGERSRWREGMLVYRDEPLREVVADVSRYTDRQVEIADDVVGAMRYTGVIYKSAANEWATALPESFPVLLISEGDRIKIKAR